MELYKLSKRGTKYNDAKLFDRKPSLVTRSPQGPRQSEIPGLDEVMAKYGFQKEHVEHIVEEAYDSIMELQTHTEKSKIDGYGPNENLSSKDVD